MARPSIARLDAIRLWLLFFLICFGLGYPTLNRYDPRTISGTADTKTYSEMASGRLAAPVDISHRFLIPWIARPFSLCAEGRVGSWNPSLFGLLVANSMFTASTALMTVLIGLLSGLSPLMSLIGALLFLLDFAAANLLLAGYVDSGESFFLACTVWSLLSGRWFLLPLWAIPGSLAKETFAPFALAFGVTWCLLDRPIRAARFGWITLSAALACASVALALSTARGSTIGPLGFALEMHDPFAGGFFTALAECVFSREFFYVYVWLLPLGLLSLPHFDRRWIAAVGSTSLLALLFGAYNGAGGNTVRALFNISAPLLCLASAVGVSKPLQREEVAERATRA